MAKQEENFTPMVQQYLDIKRQYGDIIIFFRIGDFYEMFESDAILCSKELQLYLTSKAAGNGKKIPMCGIPHRSYLSYVKKLIDRGYKVGICEQIEDPKTTKKLVKRDVIQIITPGANLDLDIKDSNYIASLQTFANVASISYSDLTTGEIFSLNIENTKEAILEELLSLDIRELVVKTSMSADIILYLKNNSNITISYSNDDTISLGLEKLFLNLKDDRQMLSTALLFNYLTTIEKRPLDYFKPVKNLMVEKRMKLDYSAISNMELVKSLDNKNFGSLFWLLDQCSTSMGSRYLKKQILSPSSSLLEINSRLDMTEVFVKNYLIREKIREDLKDIFDMERLIARMGYENCNGHDLLQLKASLKTLPKLKADLQEIDDTLISGLIEEIGDYDELSSLLERAIAEDCPITITEGGIFKKGYDSSLDDLIMLTTDAKEWINSLEAKEKEKTGIKTLRVGYNTVFGYYIEVSAGQVKDVKPEYNYIRKQTLKTGERYITPELKEQEDRILRAKDERFSLEYRLFKELRKKVATYTSNIQKTSDAIAKLDFYCSLAYVASENSYIRPILNEEREIHILNARHPIIEKASPDVNFVANDYHMSKDEDVLIITGPNMGGKSTYMKEFGLIAIMAQIGSFVPCESCNIPIFDSLFTRIGASDNLIKGQSTFMTEMSEVGAALKEASVNSLFLFDEIGRGTATFDGMAIAQSIIEFIVAHVHCKTLFSTHYHEITSLSSKIKGVKNIHCEVKESNGNVTFLYKMKDGSMDRSYGINVAKLAGLPDEIISRAGVLLSSLEKEQVVHSSLIKEVKYVKEENPVIEEIKNLDVLKMSPLDALNFLDQIKKKVK